MTLNLTAKNYTLSPDLHVYLDERIGKLTRGLTVINADIYIRKNTHHKQGNVFDVEATINVPKKMIAAKTQAPDVRAALHKLEEKLNKQIERYKTKPQNENNSD